MKSLNGKSTKSWNDRNTSFFDILIRETKEGASTRVTSRNNPRTFDEQSCLGGDRYFDYALEWSSFQQAK